jgi:iron complex outermembrane receptor protein
VGGENEFWRGVCHPFVSRVEQRVELYGHLVELYEQRVELYEQLECSSGEAAKEKNMAGSRFLTGDLESVDIMKGYTSMLLGPNNLAGAVIMRMAKPKKAFEASLKTSWDFDGGGYGGNLQAVSVGSKQDLFYGKATFQYRGVNHWRLPSSFVPSFDTDGGKLPGAGGNPQRSGDRLWSDQHDLKVSALFGVTPMEALDVWLTYAFSDANKGFSPPNVNGTSYQVWEWPYVTRHTVTLNGAFKSDALTANAKLYFDKFDNRLNNYPSFSNSITGDQAWAAKAAGIHSVSDYDDYTIGLNLDGGYQINSWNKIQGAFQFRQVNHTVYDNTAPIIAPEHTDAYKTQEYLENTWFGGVEYSVNPIKAFTAIVGFGIDAFTPVQWWKKTAPTNTLTDNKALPQWSIGLFSDLDENHELHFTYAKKNRFAAIFERSSTQGTGTNKPNPALKPIQTNNLELGYKGYFFDKINITGAVYYNYVYDQITKVTLINDPDGFKTMYDNLDATAYYGFEFGSELYLNQFFSVGGNLGVNKYDVSHSETGIKYVANAPELTANGYVVIKPFENFNFKPVANIKLIPRFEYVGSRYVSSGATKSAILESYTLVHLKASADITEYVSFSFAINNLFDELYEIAQNYPRPGRSVNLTLEGRY